jgi:hypothetical protein
MGGGRGRVGDVERPTLAAGGLMLETFSLSFGRAAGTVGGSRAAEGLGSRSRSRTGFGAVAGAGPGDAVLEEAPVGGLVVVSVLFRFSNLAKSEDTGLWCNIQLLVSLRFTTPTRWFGGGAAHEG